MNQTCGTVLEKQGRTHKWHTSVDRIHMDEQRQDDQLEHTYSSSMPIKDIALKTYRERWTIEKDEVGGLGWFTLAARHDDDDIYNTWPLS